MGEQPSCSEPPAANDKLFAGTTEFLPQDVEDINYVKLDDLFKGLVAKREKNDIDIYKLQTRLKYCKWFSESIPS